MITMCKIMIYFDLRHLLIYLDLNERVFIIVTDVIDTVLGSITRYNKQTWLNFNDEFMVP